MKAVRWILVFLCLSAMAIVPGSARAGDSSISFQLGNGTADLVQAQYTSGGQVGFITGWPVSVIEPRVELSHSVNPDYAINGGLALIWYGETDRPSASVSPSQTADRKTSISGFSVRVGADRVVKLGERATFYFGPGLEYASGKSTYESANPTENTSSTTRISVSTRLGATMWLSDGAGLTCNVGRRVGWATSDWAGAKSTWFPSSMAASGGLLFRFGE